MVGQVLPVGSQITTPPAAKTGGVLRGVSLVLLEVGRRCAVFSKCGWQEKADSCLESVTAMQLGRREAEIGR